jgi:cytochrome c biogenesis protein ResB
LPVGLDYIAPGNPDAPAGVIDLVPVQKRLFVITPDSNPFNAPELDKQKLRSGQISVVVQDLSGQSNTGVMPPNSVVNQGQPAEVDGLNITFLRESQWSLMQVANNPGIPIFWAAALLMIGGLAIVFYFPHRRIRAIISSRASGGSEAAMAPMAKRDWSARRSFEQLAMSINSRSGGSWTLRNRDDGLQSPRAASTSAAS